MRQVLPGCSCSASPPSRRRRPTWEKFSPDSSNRRFITKVFVQYRYNAVAHNGTLSPAAGGACASTYNRIKEGLAVKRTEKDWRKINLPNGPRFVSKTQVERRNGLFFFLMRKENGMRGKVLSLFSSFPEECIHCHFLSLFCKRCCLSCHHSLLLLRPCLRGLQAFFPPLSTSTLAMEQNILTALSHMHTSNNVSSACLSSQTST